MDAACKKCEVCCAQCVGEMKMKSNIKQFVIFHPSAQYDYKIYPKHLRNELFNKLNSLNIPIIITGANSAIDLRIKDELPVLDNIYDFIGQTNLEEYIALSELSLCYIGMDTLNMHIAASQNKRIFGIFGPSILNTWAPWSNSLQKATNKNSPKQTYDNITLFQADMDCVACGLAGCDDKHGASDCLNNIKPDDKQLKAVEPITYKYAGEIVNLTKEHFKGLYNIVDSLQIELKPILNNEQYERISDNMKQLKSKTKIH